MKDYKNILIIRPSALGDIAQSLPMVAILRRRFPNARLSWLVRTEFAPLLECAQGIDEVILFDRKQMGAWFYKPSAFREFTHLCKKLRAGGYDLVLDFQGLFRSAFFARVTGCPERIGPSDSREGARLFYTRISRPPAGAVHMMDHYLSMLDGGEKPDFGRITPISAPSGAKTSILTKINARGLENGRFLVLIPGAAHAYKCWPAEKFAQAAQRLHEQHGWQIAAVGTAADRPMIEAVVRHCRCKIADLSGQTTIGELTGLFEQAAAVISNDTGPGHIAIGTGAATVLVFGNTNPLRLGPYGRPEAVAAIDLHSRGDEIADQNPTHHIEHVPVEMVLEKVSDQLKLRKGP